MDDSIILSSLHRHLELFLSFKISHFCTFAGRYFPWLIFATTHTHLMEDPVTRL